MKIKLLSKEVFKDNNGAVFRVHYKYKIGSYLLNCIEMHRILDNPVLVRYDVEKPEDACYPSIGWSYNRNKGSGMEFHVYNSPKVCMNEDEFKWFIECQNHAFRVLKLLNENFGDKGRITS